MSDTPRTDALGLDIPPPNGWIYNPAYILDFSRQLERELAKVTKERDEACAELEAARSWILRDSVGMGSLVDALRKIAESTTSGSIGTDCGCMRAIARLAIDNHNKGVIHE